MNLMSIEAMAVAMTLAGVLVFLILLIRSRRWRVAGVVSTILLVTTGVWVAILTRTPPVLEREISYRPIATPDEGFLSSETCRSCHPRHYETWHDSHHRRMTQVAEPATVLGDFDDVTLHYHGRPYRLHQDDNLVWFETSRRNGEGKEVQLKRPIVLTTGSHHHQAYWYATGEGRAVEFFPFIFLIPEQRWVPRESVFLQPTVPPDTPLQQLGVLETWQKNRQWNHSCLHCHTTRGQPRFLPSEDSQIDVDTRVAEFGIACEACHGPGQEHVSANRDPIRRFRLHLSGAGDPTITNPETLPARLDSQVCGICHGVTYPKDEEQIRNDLHSGRAFRPGDEIEDTRFVCSSDLGAEALQRDCPSVSPDQRFWSDGMLRVSGREYMGLIDSPCYQRGELSCFSCHQMHPDEDDPRPLSQWADDQLKPDMAGNQACLQCHQQFDQQFDGGVALSAHTRHAPDSPGSECNNCHMPFTSYGLLKAIRSHEIHSPSVAASLDTGRPNGCNQCHLDKTLAWTAARLEGWYNQTQPEMSTIEQTVPASLIWLLSGDAGQRAIMAWTLGWDSARQTSGNHWLTPWLAQLLEDPYDAVRLIASRSLRGQPGFENINYDYLAPEKHREEMAREIRRSWLNLPVPANQVGDAKDLLDDPEGRLPSDIFSLLLRQRDDRVVMLAE